MVGDEAHHLWAAFEEARDAVGVEPLGGHRVEVVDHVVERVLHAVLGLMVVERDPQHSARHGGGATDHARLFKNHDVGRAVMVRRQRRDQRRPTASKYDDVGLDVPLFDVLLVFDLPHGVPSRSRTYFRLTTVSVVAAASRSEQARRPRGDTAHVMRAVSPRMAVTARCRWSGSPGRTPRGLQW